jgi:nucleotide-binding universal stress UspA family protein
MTHPHPPHPVQVVVAFDFSPSAEYALARAVDVAERAPQHVWHVLATLDERAGALRGISYKDAEHVQELVRDRVTATFAGREAAAEIQFFVHARIGRPAEEILRLAAEVGADLIFIGSHGKVGLERLLLGSTCERVVREAHCPVMVARAKTYPDVELLDVRPYEHERQHHAAPHRYSYVDNRVLLRPTDWPIS